MAEGDFRPSRGRRRDVGRNQLGAAQGLAGPAGWIILACPAGQTWPLGQLWPNRLVRCEVDLDKDKIRFFTLRWKEPTSYPQILEVDYRLPNRDFQD
jgi:hypothetical protein